MLILDKTRKIWESRFVMKKASLLILSAILTISPVCLAGEEKALTTITTLNGQTFHRVEVLKHDPDGLMFRHAKGIAKIPFADLSEEIQTRFNYKPETAAAFVKEHLDAEKEAKAKAAAARAESRERKATEKAIKLQMELMRQQAAMGAGSEGYVIPGFADYGVPTYGYGYGGFGLDYWPDLGPGKGDLRDLAKRKYQWDRDRLFGDYSTTKYIGPNAPLYSGSVTNSNVRPFSTFGGYRYPTDIAVRAGNPLIGNRRGHTGHHASATPGQLPTVRPRPVHGPAPRRFVPANSGGARIGGTGTLMQGGANRISHQ
jgi:hypothetical protein